MFKKKQKMEKVDSDVIETGKDNIYDIDDEPQQPKNEDKLRIITPQLVMADALNNMAGSFDDWGLRIEKRITLNENRLAMLEEMIKRLK